MRGQNEIPFKKKKKWDDSVTNLKTVRDRKIFVFFLPTKQKRVENVSTCNCNLSHDFCFVIYVETVVHMFEWFDIWNEKRIWEPHKFELLKKDNFLNIKHNFLNLNLNFKQPFFLSFNFYFDHKSFFFPLLFISKIQRMVNASIHY